MTKIGRIEKKCALCGSVHKYAAILSTNVFGSPDLDLRPAEMKRSTMFCWVHECPDCGYVSNQVSDPSSVSLNFLNSEEYLTCDGIDFSSDLARLFYKYYKISLLDENENDAFYAILHAAWACDDEKDEENARKCRLLAIPLITKLIKDVSDKKGNLLLMKADLLRRSGNFDELISEYKDVTFEDELMNRILAFQKEKAKKKDTMCYTVACTRK